MVDLPQAKCRWWYSDADRLRALEEQSGGNDAMDSMGGMGPAVGSGTLKYYQLDIGRLPCISSLVTLE